MRKLYDEIVAKGESGILALKGRQEDVDLEFKRKENPTTGEVSARDRVRLGKILSALSNSIGGLVVWGVEAKTDPATKIDYASDVRPIADIQRFKSEFLRACSQVIMPRHEGIFIEAIESQATPGAGYLAIYVERSERRPHRSEVDKHYYKRSGDSSIPMEHYDIEDSFKRLAVPTLDLSWTLARGSVRSGPQGHEFNVSIDLRLVNTSSVSARFPYVLIDEKGRTQPQNTAGIVGRNDGDGYRWEGGADIAIHPDMSLPMGSLGFTVGPVQTSRFTRVQLERFLPGIIRYRCGSANARPRSGEIKITVDALQDLPARL